MAHRLARSTSAAVVGVILAASACSSPPGCDAAPNQGCPTAAIASSPSAPSITVDKPSAAAGETVTITGVSFASRETVQILLSAIPYERASADQNGAFTTTLKVSPELPASFPIGITAIGQGSGKSAMATFERAG